MTGQTKPSVWPSCTRGRSPGSRITKPRSWVGAKRHNQSAECHQPDVQLKTKQSDNQPTRFQPPQQNNHPTTRQDKAIPRNENKDETPPFDFLSATILVNSQSILVGHGQPPSWVEEPEKPRSEECRRLFVRQPPRVNQFEEPRPETSRPLQHCRVRLQVFFQSVAQLDFNVPNAQKYTGCPKQSYFQNAA